MVITRQQKIVLGETYRFSSCANESNGESEPEVNMIEPTPIFQNSSIAIPGLKHHQPSDLDAFPTAKDKIDFTSAKNSVTISLCKE